MRSSQLEVSTSFVVIYLSIYGYMLGTFVYIMHNVGFISGVRLEVGFSGQKSIMKLGFAIAILTVNLFVDNQSHVQYNKVLD